jgi:hypothetical protein
LSSSNVEEGTPNLTVDEIKETVKRLMRGFRCKVPYTYHHRLMHASLSRPIEFVRQIPVPSIKYLKKESWPVFNKYIGPPLNRTALKRRLHIAVDPDYVVPESERQPLASTSSRQRLVREPGKIIFEAQHIYQPKVINRHQQQGQSGRPAPAVQPPHMPTASVFNTLRVPDRPVRPVYFSSLGDLRLPDRSNRTKPSPGTAAVPCQTTSSHSNAYPLATSGSSNKRTIDAVAPIAVSVAKVNTY